MIETSSPGGGESLSKPWRPAKLYHGDLPAPCTELPALERLNRGPDSTPESNARQSPGMRIELLPRSMPRGLRTRFDPQGAGVEANRPGIEQVVDDALARGVVSFGSRMDRIFARLPVDEAALLERFA